MVDQREGNPYLGTWGLRWVCNVCGWGVRELEEYEKIIPIKMKPI